MWGECGRAAAGSANRDPPLLPRPLATPFPLPKPRPELAAAAARDAGRATLQQHPPTRRYGLDDSAPHPRRPSSFPPLTSIPPLSTLPTLPVLPAPQLQRQPRLHRRGRGAARRRVRVQADRRRGRGVRCRGAERSVRSHDLLRFFASCINSARSNLLAPFTLTCAPPFPLARAGTLFLRMASCCSRDTRASNARWRLNGPADGP